MLHSREHGLKSLAVSLNFKLQISHYHENNIIHHLNLHQVTRPKKNNNLLRTVCIYTTTNFTRTISAALKNNTTEGKGARLQFPPTPVGLVPGFVLSESARGRRGANTVRPEFTLQSASAERPVVNRQRRGKQRGISQSSLEKGRVRVAFN